MNHAQKNEYIADLEKSIKSAEKVTLNFLKHIQSSKFHCGDDLDNYINTSDVHSWIMAIREKLFNNTMQFHDCTGEKI